MAIVSVETKSALDSALAAHINDEADGALVSGYVLQAAYFNGDTITNGTCGYIREFAEGQMFHVGLGLATMLDGYFRDSNQWDYDIEDDDD